MGTPYRFCLTMSDTTIIGMRRAAQVIGANALKRVQANATETPMQACQQCLKDLADATDYVFINSEASDKKKAEKEGSLLDRAGNLLRNPAVQVGLAASALGLL